MNIAAIVGYIFGIVAGAAINNSTEDSVSGTSMGLITFVAVAAEFTIAFPWITGVWL